MSEIYKINRVVNNKISHIYVFSGDCEDYAREIYQHCKEMYIVVYAIYYRALFCICARV